MTTTVVNLRGRHREDNGYIPEGIVYIGGKVNQGGWRVAASKWANPFPMDTPATPSRPGQQRDGTREEVIAKYRTYLLGNAELMAALPELRGKVLGCWCTPQACHGDVLAELADA